MGIAIEVGFNPVALDADFWQQRAARNWIYFNFAVSEDGVVFVGYKNNILRYAPNAQGSFNAPTVATLKEDGSDRWHQWRWENLRISGTGIETLILAGGKTWRPNQGYHLLSTTDGETFDKFDLAEDFKVGGGASLIHPGACSGRRRGRLGPYQPLSRIQQWHRYSPRRVGDDLGFLDFTNDGTFRPGRDPHADPETDYVTEFISDIDGDSSLGYVVTTAPQLNSAAVDRLPARPGFWDYTPTVAMSSEATPCMSGKQRNFREMPTYLSWDLGWNRGQCIGGYEGRAVRSPVGLGHLWLRSLSHRRSPHQPSL